MVLYLFSLVDAQTTDLIVDLCLQPTSKMASLLYSSFFLPLGVDKKKAHLLRFPTLNEGRPPQKPIQREGKEGVRLYRIGVSSFLETLCIKTVWWTVFVKSLFELRYCYLIFHDVNCAHDEYQKRCKDSHFF